MTTRILSLIAFVVCTSASALFAQDATPYVPTPRTAVNTIYFELAYQFIYGADTLFRVGINID
jgi:hypothetical protein